MKTKEESKQIKEEVEKLGGKLKSLSEDELKEVAGGYLPPTGIICGGIKKFGVNDGIGTKGDETNNIVAGH